MKVQINFYAFLIHRFMAFVHWTNQEDIFTQYVLGLNLFFELDECPLNYIGKMYTWRYTGRNTNEGEFGMKFIDISGTIYEVCDDKIIVRKKNGKETLYSISNMYYPNKIKDGIFGTCSFLIEFRDGKTIQILCNKENKEYLEKFWTYLGCQYSEIIRNFRNETRSKCVQSNTNLKNNIELLKCPCCGGKISNQAEMCPHCGQPISNNKSLHYDDKGFDGIYRKTLFSGLQEVYCPRCRSSNCSHYKEQKVIPGKTKTKYTANLNPLKPFTLVNKKEKVIRKDQVITESKFICNNCGKIFY